MSPGFAIRLATREDEPAVNALLQASYPALMNPAYDRDLLAPALAALTRAQPALLRSGTYYLAETESARLVGCGGWTLEMPGQDDAEDGLGHIRHFATHPEWTGRAVGRSIYAVCERQARAEGVTCFECHSSLNAEGFYAALGFDSIRRMDFPMGSNLTLPGVLMRRSI